MTSRTSPGVAAMSMLLSVGSAMRQKLHRLPFEPVLQSVDRTLPPQGVADGHVTRRARPPRAPDVVVHDRAVPPRLDPHLHLAVHLPGDLPPHPLQPTVAGHLAPDVRPHPVGPVVVVELGADEGGGGVDEGLVDDVDAAGPHGSSVPHVTYGRGAALPRACYRWVGWRPEAVPPSKESPCRNTSRPHSSSLRRRAVSPIWRRCAP